jgi:hypothetical protein
VLRKPKDHARHEMERIETGQTHGCSVEEQSKRKAVEEREGSFQDETRSKARSKRSRVQSSWQA